MNGKCFRCGSTWPTIAELPKMLNVVPVGLRDTYSRPVDLVRQGPQKKLQEVVTRCLLSTNSNFTNINTPDHRTARKQMWHMLVKAQPKIDGSYLGCIRCGAIDHFPRDCKFISHKCWKCNLTGHSETKCVIAKVKQAKSNAATNITFPITQENNDSTSEQLLSMKLYLERDSKKFEVFGILDCACIYTSINASFAASMNLPVTLATNYCMNNATGPSFQEGLNHHQLERLCTSQINHTQFSTG